MTDTPKESNKPTEGSIDYNAPQAEIDKAKQKARDADSERLRQESE